MKENKDRRYKSVKGHKGIRKDLWSNTFQAYKTINGFTSREQFKSLSDAIKWRLTYNPLLDNEPVPPERAILFKDMWLQYKDTRLCRLEKSTQEQRSKLIPFLEYFLDMPVMAIKPKIIMKAIDEHKKISDLKGNSKRCTYDQELKFIKTIFTWGAGYLDYKIPNPVTPMVMEHGRFRKPKRKNKQMKPDEIMIFLKELKKDNEFWHDLAFIQFFCASRISETAGLHKCNINFESNTLLIKEVIVW